MMPEPDENRLDQSLRSKFDDFDLAPGAPVWAGIEARLGPSPRLRPRRRPWLVPLLLVLTAFVGGLGGWLLPHGPAATLTSRPGVGPATSGPPAAREAVAMAAEHKKDAQPVATAEASRKRSLQPVAMAKAEPKRSLQPVAMVGANRKRSLQPVAIAKSDRKRVLQPVATTFSGRKRVLQLVAMLLPASRGAYPATQEAAAAVATAATASAAVLAAVDSAQALPADAMAAAAPTAADALPATLRPLAALERQTLVQLPGSGNLAPGALPADGRAALLTTLRGERAELFRLQRRTDSLLLALGDLPGAPRLAARPDSTQQATTNQQLPTNRWSLLLTATPEQNTLALQGAEGDSLTALRRNHETGRAGFSAGLLAEYRLTPRLSVGGGVGYTALGADLRITNKSTQLSVRYDSVTTTTIGVFSSTRQTYSIRIVQTPQLSPVFNGNGQVIRYDTVYVPRQDTVFTTTVQRDTVRTNRTTVTPNISKKETLTTRLLQPNYRFFTVPVLLRYRLATPGTGRLWTDVAVGAQLQFFLGGTQVATDDGEHFRTERITVASSPFRALNVALSGALAINYALTPRLSVSVAPSLRWQALSLYKPETGLRQQATSTGLMFGLRFGL